MEKTTHLFEDGIYHISSHVVARSPLFYKKSLVVRFLEKLDFYLSPYCEILHYSIHNEEFQLLIRLFSREKICANYRRANQLVPEDNSEIPLTTYIFSKAMSDLLVSTAKHFNYHHGRKGSLFASRYKRKLIESKADFEKTMDQMSAMKKVVQYLDPWDKCPKGYRLYKKRKELAKIKERCAWYFYQRKSAVNRALSSFRNGYKVLDLRGCFKQSPPKSIYTLYTRFTVIYYLPKHHHFP